MILSTSEVQAVGHDTTPSPTHLRLKEALDDPCLLLVCGWRVRGGG